MVEGRVWIERPTAYFTGENVRSSVQFTNKGTSKESLMWATAQIVCHAALHKRYVHFPVGSATSTPISGNSPPLRRASYSVTSLQPPPMPVVREGQVITVFQSSADILFCDLELDPGQSETFHYSAKLPEDGPATHRGTAVKYTYRLVVTAQKLNEPTQAVSLPLKIFQCKGPEGGTSSLIRRSSLACYSNDNIHPSNPPTGTKTKTPNPSPAPSPLPTENGKVRFEKLENPGSSGNFGNSKSPGKNSGNVESSGSVGTSTGLESVSSKDDISRITCSNPFFQKAIEEAKQRIEQLEKAAKTKQESEREEEGVLDSYATPTEVDAAVLKGLLHRLATMTLRQYGSNRPHTYRIGSRDTTVCMFTLFKPTYRLGEEVLGQLDFDGATLPCHQVCVALETCEGVVDEYKPVGPPVPIRPKVHAEFFEYCRHTSRTYINIPIPITATPEFATTFVKLQWYLRFEFVTERTPRPLSDGRGSIPTSPQMGEDQDHTSNIQRQSSVAPSTEDRVVHAPDRVPVQPLRWLLPITVLPTNPANLPPSVQHSVLSL